MLTIVTTTRNRSLCFGLCEKWMAAQTVKPDQWLVINDGEEEYTYNAKQMVIKRNPGGDELPSLLENWLAALPLIYGDKVAVIEDDDWYHPEYLATLTALLDEVDLAGFRDDVYYKLPLRKFLKMHNKGHASLAATAFKSSMIPQIERCCLVHKSIFIDMFLWAEATQEGAPWKCALGPNKAEDGRAYHVGMKQLPGEKGLGIGHGNDGFSDPKLGVLRGWVGRADCLTYSEVLRTAYEYPRTAETGN